MRASDLIGLGVFGAAGERLGVVTDLRCVQDGPLRGSMQAPRVAALIVSRRHTGSLLGYDRRSQHGPWMVRTLVQRLHRHAVLIPWETSPTRPAGSRFGTASPDSKTSPSSKDGRPGQDDARTPARKDDLTLMIVDRYR